MYNCSKATPMTAQCWTRGGLICDSLQLFSIPSVPTVQDNTRHFFKIFAAGGTALAAVRALQFVLHRRLTLKPWKGEGNPHTHFSYHICSCPWNPRALFIPAGSSLLSRSSSCTCQEGQGQLIPYAKKCLKTNPQLGILSGKASGLSIVLDQSLILETECNFK